MQRRAAGEPLQYVLGRWGFRQLDLLVDRRVLIPRPETEQVVEVALAELDRRRASGGRPVVVDLGTGSGAIALSVAAERPGVDVWATDASPDALAVAAANLAGLGGWGATRVRLVQGSWWTALPSDLAGRIDLAVTNPPYIAGGEMGDLDPGGHPVGAPRGARGRPDGLEQIQVIIAEAPSGSPPPGCWWWRSPRIRRSTYVHGQGRRLRGRRVKPDLAGLDRALIARRRGNTRPGASRAFPFPLPAIAIRLSGGHHPGEWRPAAFRGDRRSRRGAARRRHRRDPDRHRLRAGRRPLPKRCHRSSVPGQRPASQRRAAGAGGQRGPGARAHDRGAPGWASADGPVLAGSADLVLPRRPDLDADLGADDATIGLRCPAHPVPLAVCGSSAPSPRPAPTATASLR